ncbi:hypothetical protein E4T56_gene292, partial [Termitomyces sp. T112]
VQKATNTSPDFSFGTDSRKNLKKFGFGTSIRTSVNTIVVLYPVGLLKPIHSGSNFPPFAHAG